MPAPDSKKVSEIEGVVVGPCWRSAWVTWQWGAAYLESQQSETRWLFQYIQYIGIIRAAGFFI